MDSKKFCTGCKTFHFESLFVWDSNRHKTYIKCKQNHNLRKQNNTVSVNSELSQPTNSESSQPTNIESSQPANLEFNSEELNVKDEAEYMRIEIDYFDMGNFIENEIQELTESISAHGVADTAYKTQFLVKMNLDAYNMTAKEIANLIITKIEGGDDFSWM